jgi:hypothetical protein
MGVGTPALSELLRMQGGVLRIAVERPDGDVPHRTWYTEEWVKRLQDADPTMESGYLTIDFGEETIRMSGGGITFDELKHLVELIGRYRTDFRQGRLYLTPEEEGLCA